MPLGDQTNDGPRQPSDVVALRTDQCAQRIAERTLQPATIHAVVCLGVPDGRLDGLATLEPASLPGDVCRRLARAQDACQHQDTTIAVSGLRKRRRHLGAGDVHAPATGKTCAKLVATTFWNEVDLNFRADRRGIPNPLGVSKQQAG